MNAPPVQYVRTSDGYDIAYAISGTGQPFVYLPPAATHIELYWTENTFARAWLQGLAERFLLIQYDGRGQGMSTRALKQGLSISDLVSDLELIVDHLELDEFVLMGQHWSGHVALRYAHAHPERVKALVIANSVLDLGSWTLAILRSVSESDWDNFLRTAAGLSQSSAIEESVQRLRQAFTQPDWNILMAAAVGSDVGPLLQDLATPTLVMHSRGSLQTFSEDSRKLAAAIPHSRSVVLDTLNEPGLGIKTIEDFLGDLSSRQQTQVPPGPPASLSARELEVLRLVAQGKSNQRIADELVISIWTVTNHLTHILNKTGASNRTEAASYAHRHRLV